ncbi:S-(hydroxymethyl)glutathione dehydrogenase/alcohol dehydrogenase [Bradyrhizobium huanghuaihaiense]|uniref:S-(Hydroxymethyl)glutathione dehydrogenase/alcohol dehydrogenase n=1 Tax=Bradyrhizobium huanghuaihaiense TaxID=990078 RepID=A0A562QTU5_9BRAD|nr:zinc-binding dehydrogenase [Bradyrhizobium huanghuaihaiense]TWI60238.1 S-(hydroxymethyl)glutathione dehydrogenase/alcohol dehydrogenase [Bradyrhizobium huanghuaihaiense]
MDIKTAKAAILVESGKPLIVDEFTLPDTLEHGQVLAHVHTSSICGAQINEIDAVKGVDKFLPHLLGHEALATIVETGPGVVSCKEGDTVVMHWRPGKGIQSNTPVYSWRGKRLNAGWVTTFNDYAVVSENRVTPVPASIDRTSAPLLGCAVTTALGVVNNDAQIAIGEAVVVFGVGGVGLNIVQFAAMVGAHPVIAIDRLDNKLEMAKQFGATHTVNSDAVADVAAAVRAITGADGPDKVVETTGVRRLIELAYEVTAKKGRCILVGVPREKVEIYTLPLHFEKVLKGSEGGQCQPARDIPRLVRLDEAGKVSYRGIVTHEFALDDVNDALDLMRSGESGRILLNIS